MADCSHLSAGDGWSRSRRKRVLLLPQALRSCSATEHDVVEAHGIVAARVDQSQRQRIDQPSRRGVPYGAEGPERVSDDACCREGIPELDFLASGPGADDDKWDRRRARVQVNRLEGEDLAAGRDLDFAYDASPSRKEDREGRRIAVDRPHLPGGGPQLHDEAGF